MISTNYPQDQTQSPNVLEELNNLNLDFVTYEKKRNTDDDQKKRIVVYHGKRIVPVKVKDIYAVFTDNNYRFIHTHDEKYSCTYTLENMEQMFGSFFFRVNRQYLISYDSIDQILVEDSTKLCVKLKKPLNIVMQISRRKTNQFIRWLEMGY